VNAPIIRHALPHEHAALSAIARQAKAHWGYPQAALAGWRHDLSVTPESIAACPTFAAEHAGVAVGFVQLRFDGARAELEHLWVQPAHIGRGIGRVLLQRALDTARAAGHDMVRIDADPHAEAFYRACGATRTGTVPAPIDGEPQRVRPQLELRTLRHDAHAADPRPR
jgi:GNAT superfamily N-acetyltransferase